MTLLITLPQGMTDLPDYKKIEFPDMPPIPFEELVPDGSPEVCTHVFMFFCRNLFINDHVFVVSIYRL